MASERSDEAMKPDDALAEMIERLQSDDVLHTSTVKEALSAVRRHDFIEGASVETAYADIAVIVKTTEAGTAISSASQPTIVAAMLELSLLEPGHRVLEIGAGTGYNAALLSSIVGPAGLVVTVELEDDLALAAEDRLRTHGFTNVVVVTGDGANGYLQAAPYDRIIVTTGAPSIAPAWPDQLREDGRLVVPIVGSDGFGAIRCLIMRGTELEEIETMPCGFLPMRTS